MSWERTIQQLVGSPNMPKASQLATLSYLPEGGKEMLAQVWPRIPTARKRTLLNILSELMGDNLDLDFHSVFLVALDDPDAEVRALAVRGLWEYEGQDLVPKLIHLLQNDPSPLVREGAALVLGQFVLRHHLGHLKEKHYRPIEEALRQTFEDETERPEVRGRALEALGSVGHLPWVKEAIRSAYESLHTRLRISAIHAMGFSADPAWLPILLHELQNDDPEYRYQAALACGSIGDPKAIPYLTPLLHDDDLETRLAAIAALGQIGDEEAKAALLPLRDDPSPAIREAVATALQELEFLRDPLGP